MALTVIALLVVAFSNADIDRLRRYAEFWDLADHPEWAPMTKPDPQPAGRPDRLSEAASVRALDGSFIQA